jgi:hypothetical protein
MSNIDKILDGFNSNPKKITYEDYLKWSGGDQNMFSYIAFYKLMKMPKVKAKDLVNVYENFSPEYIRENLELNSNEDDGAAAIRFCNEYPGKPECICVNNTLIQIAKLDRDKIEFRNSYNIVDLNNKVKNWIYQYKVKEYDEVIDPAQRLKYKNEEHFVEERAKVRGPPDAGNKWDPGRWRDDWGAFNTNNWRGYYSDEYINRELMPIFKINNYPNEELYKSDELPKPGAFELKSNCCSNVLEAHANVTMENIKLSCNQKIMSLSAMKEAEERAAAEEAEEKRKEEEEKREAAEEADAKKKKMFKYIVIGIVSLVFIGIVGFAAYKIFTSNSGTSDLGTSDLGTSDSGASDSGASDLGTSDSGASNLIVIGIVSLVFIGIIGFAAYKIFTSNSGSPDLGTSDSGSSDLSASDSGSSDLSASDSGSPDLGTSDSGTSEEEEEAAILAAEEADEKKKRMFKYIVIGIVSLVFIGIFGFAAYKIFTSNSGDDESGASESGASEAGSPDLGDSEAETPSVRDAYE